MKTCLKTIVLATLSTVVVFTGLTYTSCNPDKCKAITCAYGGVCNDGDCTCATGYEGSQCEKITRNKFVATWKVSEKGSLTNSQLYTLDIAAGAAINEVVITNFNNTIPHAYKVQATVSQDTLYIPRQRLYGRVIEGRGYLVPDVAFEEYGSMTVQYYVTDTATGRTNDYGWDIGLQSNWSKQK